MAMMTLHLTGSDRNRGFHTRIGKVAVFVWIQFDDRQLLLNVAVSFCLILKQKRIARKTGNRQLQWPCSTCANGAVVNCSKAIETLKQKAERLLGWLEGEDIRVTAGTPEPTVENGS